jgi:hypothetical protein
VRTFWFETRIEAAPRIRQFWRAGPLPIVMADGFEHETERVQPEAREVRRRILRPALGSMDLAPAQRQRGFVHIAHLLERGGDERVPQGVGPTRLVMPALRATRRTTLPAAWRSRRWPSEPTKIGPSPRSPTARSMARAVRGATRTVTTLPPLRTMVSVRWPFEAEGFDVGAGGFRDP